ncbi:MAG: hypothetical protein ACI9VR_004537 [Cognaticolwellia sp.]|jgi:hypothetical protein
MSELSLTRLDTLLMRVLDDQASKQEHQELLALADAEPRLAEQRALRESLRAALIDAAMDPIDVVPQVLAALAIDDPWQSIASGLREAVDGDIDLADGIMAALGGAALTEQAVTLEQKVSASLGDDPLPTAEEARGILLSAMVDGELSRAKRAEISGSLADDKSALDQMTQFAELGRVLRTAVELETRQSNLDGLWEEICPKIGVEDPEHVPGWEQTAAMLRDAVQEHATMSAAEEGAFTAAIMNGIPAQEHLSEVQKPEREPAAANDRFWRVMGDPRSLMVAAAALCAVVLGLNFITGNNSPSVDVPVQPSDPVAQLVETPDLGSSERTAGMTVDHNHAEVEELESGHDVTVHIMPGMEGAPMFLMIDEGDEGATL